MHAAEHNLKKQINQLQKKWGKDLKSRFHYDIGMANKHMETDPKRTAN